MTHMKTTLELSDELLMEAKALAARRRTTLKALFTRALERELRGEAGSASPERFKVDESGWPVLQRPPQDRPVVTDGFIQALRDSEGV